MHIKLDQRAYYKVRTTAPLACLYHSTSETFAIRGPGISDCGCTPDYNAGALTKAQNTKEEKI